MKIPDKHGFLLVTAALLWGATFVMVQNAVADGLPVAFFLGARFTLAVLVLLPWALRHRTDLVRDGLRVLPIGLTILAANLLQTYGLGFTSAANSAFITGLYFVFTPFLGWLFWRTRLEKGMLRVLLLTGIGFGLLCWNPGMALNPGDLLTLLCAIAVALQILWIDRAHGRGVSIVSLVFYQNFWVGIPSLGLAFASGALPDYAAVPFSAWAALVITGIFCSAFAFWAQAVGQQGVSATRAALFFMLEPVSGALIDYAVNGIAPPAKLLGGAIILGALLFDWRQRRAEQVQSP